MVFGDVLFEPDHFGKYFHDLFENNSDKRKPVNWKKNKNGKKYKPKYKGKNKDGTVVEMGTPGAPDLEIPSNASHFGVYFAVRSAVLERWMRQAVVSFISSSAATALGAPVSEVHASEMDSDTEDATQSRECTPVRVPKIVGIGLKSVFELIKESRSTHPALCTKALKALLDVIQGQSPEGLKNEPPEVLDTLFDLLLDLATLHGPGPSVADDGTHLTALACSCLLALVVVQGDTGKLLSAVAALLMCPRALALQNIQMPAVLASLQRSVHAILLGKSTRPDFLSHGIPKNCIIDTFPILTNLENINNGVGRALASDGKYLYLLSNKGLSKIGTGYGGSLKGYMYAHNKDIGQEKAWLGYCNNTLYYKLPGMNPLCEINKDSLQLIGNSGDHSTTSVSSKTAAVMFSDGESLGMITAAKDDAFIVRTFNSSTPLDLPLKLARKCLETFGGNSVDDEAGPIVGARNPGQITLPGDEEIVQVAFGKEFGLVRSSSGKVFYTGKASSLGVKQAARPSVGKFTELTAARSPRITLIAVGHEGSHAILLGEDGSVLFTGTARRGEDGDLCKARRQPRATKPKKMIRVEAHNIVHAACNHGTTALVTKNGKLFMFGKDTAHCDQSTGLVTDLMDESIVSVSLGKAHTVALTSKGSVFTFGINNKGQCGREYVAIQKEVVPTAMETSSQNIEEEMETEALGGAHVASASPVSVDIVDHRPQIINAEGTFVFICLSGEHSWRHDVCMVCTVCTECTGYSVSCLSSIRPDRKPGQECGCGEGDGGCVKCGICRVCARESFDNLVDQEFLGSNGANNYADARHDNVEKSLRKRYSLDGGLRKRIEHLEEPRKNALKGSQAQSKAYLLQQKQKNRIVLNGDKAVNNKSHGAVIAEEQNAGSDIDRADPARASTLAPARLGLFEKGNDPIVQVSCGLHHTVMLTASGEVYTFGSNQWGQLGTGDLQPQSGLQYVRVPGPVVQVAAGSNHTVMLNNRGEVYCFGNFLKGQLGCVQEQNLPGNSQNPHKSAKSAFWHCQPVLMSRLGVQFGRRATWIGASGEQTFVKIDESLINANSLVKSTIVTNKTCIMLLPNHIEQSFKCLVINKRDGTCTSHSGNNQADLSEHTVCLDPIYGVLWSCSPSNKISCYNIVASEAKNVFTSTESDMFTSTSDLKKKMPTSNKIQDFSSMKEVKVESGKSKDEMITSVEGFQNTGLKTILNAELALPVVSNCFISRSQAAIHLLCCLDTMTLAYDQKLTIKEDATVDSSVPAPNKPVSHEEYHSVNRFDSHGGGWGYSGHSVEAIRFMCDSDVILGGFGLFGGRGEYASKIKLLDLGVEGGEQEGDGELLAETEEAPYECAPRQKHPVMFDEPVHIQAGRWYIAWARVSGPSSDCGSSGLHMVLTEDQVQFNFKSSKKSNNGTDVNAGQIPSLLYRIVSPESHPPPRQTNQSEPICILSKDFSRSVTKDCFQSLLSLLQWSWNTFKMGLVDVTSYNASEITTGQLLIRQELDRLVYISKASLRLLRSFTNEIYPSHITRKLPQESLRLAECVGDVRALLMQILSDTLPNTNSKKTGKVKLKSNHAIHVNNGLTNMSASILEECHKTFVSCYHAFYPTANLKWQCLCDLLFEMDKDPLNTQNTSHLLSAVLAALCSPSVRLRSTLPVLSAIGLGEPFHKSQISPSDNAGLPMVSSLDGHHYPVLVEQMSYRSQLERNDFVGWQFNDVLERLLDIVTLPVKQTINSTLKHSKHVTVPPISKKIFKSNSPSVYNKKMPIDMHNSPSINNYSVQENHNDNNVGDSVLTNNFRYHQNSIENHKYGNIYMTAQLTNQVPGLVTNCCYLLARVVAELAHQSTGSDEDLQNACGRTLHCTPSRFSRSNQSRTWNTGNGSPDAICFSVDRPGLAIAGAVIYGGTGHYDYELEILDDQSVASSDPSNTHTHRWTSLQLVEGTLGPDDCNKDLAEIKFEKPVPIKENKKYAIRLRNHGGRTSNGDGGLSSVQGPCGATFHFSTCSLSFNGTTQSRGQIPSLLYYSNPLDSDNQHSSRAILEQQARKSTLDMVTTITHRCRDLFAQARESLGNSLDLEIVPGHHADLSKALGDSCIVNTLIPLVLAHAVPLLGDPRSAVQMLSLIQELMPHVAALNQISQTSILKSEPEIQMNFGHVSHHTTSMHYAWVETDHPYKPASVANYRVLFPESVKWLTLEFDPLCGTAQSEDILQLYIPSNSTNNNVAPSIFNPRNKTVIPGASEPVSHSANGEEDEKNVQPYWPMLHKMGSCGTQWPTSAVILPGREVIFSLETASDYLKDDRANYYGFKCLVIGYEMTHGALGLGHNGLQLLENELAHLGGMCAASLIRRDLALPAVTDEQDSDMDFVEDVALLAQSLHSTLLSRGLALSQTPTIQQALDGTLPLSAHSNGRQFLRDFVSGSGGSSGARLAMWLQPEPRLCPGNCEIVCARDDLRCGWPNSITIITKDQYGDVVHVPNLRIDVNAIPIDKSSLSCSGGRKMRRVSQSDPLTFGGLPPPSLTTPYEVTVRDKMCFTAISIMKAYNNYSFEELRFASPMIKRSSETMLVRANSDGTYSAAWTPSGVGCYALSVVIDGYQMEEVFRVEVRDPPAGMPPPTPRVPPRQAQQPSRLRRFVTRPSAGLRIRAHPTLQSEQLGIVMVDGTIAFVDETHNDDGVWLRLSMDTIKEYCGPGINEAWCLQYNQHLGRTLLLPVEQPKSILDQVIKETIMKKSPEIAYQKSPPKPNNFVIGEDIFMEQNIKSHPSKKAANVGAVHTGDLVSICSYVSNNEGTWAKLDTNTIKFHRNRGDRADEAWIMAVPYFRRFIDLSPKTDNEIQTDPKQTCDWTKRCGYDFSVGAEIPGGSCFSFKPSASPSKFGTNNPFVEPQATAATNPFFFGGKTDPLGSENIVPKEDTKSPNQSLKQHNIPSTSNNDGITRNTTTVNTNVQAKSTTNLSNSPGISNSTNLCHSGTFCSNSSNFSSSGSSICSVANVGNAINSVVGSSGNKFQAIQKWFKGGEINKHTEGKDKKIGEAEKHETSSISVRDLVKAMGESRANGNGATPPDTPKRARSPKALGGHHSRSSSPVAIPIGRLGGLIPDSHTSSSPQATGSPRSIGISPLVSGAVLERRGSTQSDTSALVSSLTRDLSQSPSQGTTTANTRDLSPSPSNSSIIKSEDLLDSPRKLAQTGTQTSPENTDASGTTAIRSQFSIGASSAKEERISPKLGRKDRPLIPPKSRPKRSISPGISIATSINTSPARPIPSCSNEPVKKALAPSVAESLRAMFAAFLWHEGIVHDAMACASFLKFHPTLPKQGALVVTRAQHPVSSDRVIQNNRTSELTKEERARQRHSVEVTTAGKYLQIQPSTLESLTRSAANANANRSRQRKSNAEVIKEEVGDSSGKFSSLPEVIAILPPALKSIVVLWEELSNNCLQVLEQNSIMPSPTKQPATSMSVNRSKHSSSKNDLKEHKEREYNNEKQDGKLDGRRSCGRRKLWRSMDKANFLREDVVSMLSDRFKGGEFPCELCGGSFPPAVTYHMRSEHPGCGADAEGKGYNSGGYWCVGWAGNCGDGGVAGSSWYLLCDSCRDKYLKAKGASNQPPKPSRSNVKPVPNTTKKPQLPKLISPVSSSSMDLHVIMKNNAMFLLDLASAAGSGIACNQRRLSQTGLPSVSERSPPDPAGPWAPLPPFQCLTALGATSMSQEATMFEEELKRHTIQENGGQRPLSEVSLSDTESDLNHGLRFHRSISMGQSGQDGPFGRVAQGEGRLIMMRKRNYSSGEMNNDAGSSLLCYPSSNLQKLIPNSSAIVSGSPSGGLGLLARSSMMFLFQNHDLAMLQLAMKHAIRKATCRVFALQAMNWLLRSVTQPACIHDILWWFVCSLSPGHQENENENDNKPDHRAEDPESANLCDHPISDLFFSGDLCSPLAVSFHGFLQSVADLTLSLPPGSPLQMMAVRCFGIKFMPSDHAFLHRSHVFGNISKILSRSEEESNEEITNSLYDSHLSVNHNATSVVESLHDVTNCIEIRASSRQAMVGSLTDSSTETFWESGEEDRNKAKTLDVTCSGANPGVVYVHVDNSRDIGNKVNSISFFTGTNFSELTLIKTTDVESRAGTWFACYLPDSKHTHIRLDIHGPDNSLRVRQIRLLGTPAGKQSRLIKQHSPTNIQRRNCETETLKVFRLITSQVFGKLILGESQPENINCALERDQDQDNSPGDSGSLDLREHMVGILFSRSKLTHLQKQVIVHIVQAIRKECIKAREEWEATLCSPTSAVMINRQHSSTESLAKAPDTYCFEMLSMVLALSGSSVGRAYLSHQFGLLRDLFSLLHTGSARVQRQVTSLLRRMLPEISPSSLCTVLSVSRLPPQDYSIVSATNKDLQEHFDMNSMGILDVFLSCISKALTVQVKAQSRGSSLACLAASIRHGAHREQTDRWWLGGCMARKQAEGIIALLKDMAAGKLSEAWAQVTKGAVAESILNLTRLDESYRVPQKCLQTPTLWLALAALCVLDSDHVERLSSGQWSTNETTGAPPRPTCSNHDDGETSAIIQCSTCGNLCADCDRILHLHRRTRMHQRTVCKEEEEAIKVDLHEGCGRTKLFWLLALTDSATLKALVEFREGRSARSASTNTGTCRFCGTTGNSGLLAIGNVCADAECQEYGRTACSKLHPCGHICGGIAGEKQCLPCLHGCSHLQVIDDPKLDFPKLAEHGLKTLPEPSNFMNKDNHWSDVPSYSEASNKYAFRDTWEDDLSNIEQNVTNLVPRLTQDADDMCMICFTEALACAPAIQLACGHVFHSHCCRSVLSKRWAGPRITFSFSQCPICKSNIEHPTLGDLLSPVRELFNDVKRKATMRLEYENLHKADPITTPGSRYHKDPTSYAMDRYAYYVCYKCNKAYYGGEARCDAEMGESYDPRELVCGGCSDVARAQMCPKHGADFLEYKCRYCCSVAVFFCFGTTHFCNNCHDDFQRVTNIPRLELPNCPAGPKAQQLDGDECPLHVKHPSTGEEFALGCGVCRNAHTF